MLRASVAAIALSSVFASGSFAGSDLVGYASEAAKAQVNGEAKWIRAERDRANAILARDFVEGSATPADGGHAMEADGGLITTEHSQ
jgi:hypothetical protein